MVEKFKIVLEKTRFFLIVYLMFLLGVSYVLFNYTNNEGVIMVNSTWTDIQDLFFIYSTYLGEGYIPLVVIVSIALFFSIKNGIIALSSFVFTALVTQFLKQVIFPDAMRPFIELWNEFKYGELHMALGEEFMKKGNSFPSGHTTSAFSLFVILTLFSKRPFYGVVFGLLAVSAAYSRVYLGQHFFEDIFLGSIIGVLGTLFVYFVFEYKGWLSKFDVSFINYRNNGKKII